MDGSSSQSRRSSPQTRPSVEPQAPGDLFSLNIEESEPSSEDQGSFLAVDDVLPPPPDAPEGLAAAVEPAGLEPDESSGDSPVEEEREFQLNEDAVPSALFLPKGEVEARAIGEESISVPDLDILPDHRVSIPDEPPGPVVTAELPLAGGMESAPPGLDRSRETPGMLWAEEQGAGFWRRSAAFTLDQMIITATLALFYGGASLTLKLAGIDWSRQSSPEGLAAAFLPFYLLGLGLSMGYFTFFPGWRGKTIGKMLFNLEVSRLDGERMSYTRSFLRWVGYLVSATFVGLGFVWVLFDEKRRGWHDYLSGTWVREVAEKEKALGGSF
jgi:uncharacterized RDD family membrane protein YckC